MGKHPWYVDVLDELQDEFDHAYPREGLETAFLAGVSHGNGQLRAALSTAKVALERVPAGGDVAAYIGRDTALSAIVAALAAHPTDETGGGE